MKELNSFFACHSIQKNQKRDFCLIKGLRMLLLLLIIGMQCSAMQEQEILHDNFPPRKFFDQNSELKNAQKVDASQNGMIAIPLNSAVFHASFADNTTERIVATARDVHFFDSAGKQHAMIDCAAHPLNAAVCSKNGRWVVGGSGDAQSICVFDITKSQCVLKAPFACKGQQKVVVYPACLNDDESVVAFGVYGDNLSGIGLRLVLFDMKSHQIINTITQKASAATLSWVGNDQLYCGNDIFYESNPAIWQYDHGKINSFEQKRYDAAYFGSGSKKSLLGSTRYFGWAESNESLDPIAQVRDDIMTVACWRPDEKEAFVGCLQLPTEKEAGFGQLYRYHAESKKVHLIEKIISAPHVLKCTNDGKSLIGGTLWGSNESAFVYDNDTSKNRLTVHHDAAVNAVALSHDKTVFVSGDSDGSLKITQVPAPSYCSLN